MKIGAVRVRLISADLPTALDKISKSGMILQKLRIKDSLSAEFLIEKSCLRPLNALVQHRGDTLEVISHEGIYWGLRHLIRRPVFVSGVLILLFFTLWLPSRVFFVEIQGNGSVPAKLILEAAENCGIRFGAKTREIRSEKLKNSLLQQIPTLQWAGINTDGCVAVISVREKTEQAQTEYSYPVSSMVASMDGYITEMTVTAGSPSCKVGQSVEKGQVLISAYTDCGTHLLAVKAEGEVYANTKRQISAVTPVKSRRKSKIIRTEQRFGLILGKKLINFENWSGIYGGECDRIKSVHYITLPGGFQLPFGIVSETVVLYETDEYAVPEESANALLTAQAKTYLLDRMIAGRVENQDIRTKHEKGCYILTGDFDCNEMICQIRTEEILQNHEQRD